MTFLLNNILKIIIFFQIFGILLITIIPSAQVFKVKITALVISSITFLLSTTLWIFFDNSIAEYQFIEQFVLMPSYNINLLLGIDGVSIFFVLLTTFLIPICLLTG